MSPNMTAVCVLEPKNNMGGAECAICTVLSIFPLSLYLMRKTTEICAHHIFAFAAFEEKTSDFFAQQISTFSYLRQNLFWLSSLIMIIVIVIIIIAVVFLFCPLLALFVIFSPAAVCRLCNDPILTILGLTSSSVMIHHQYHCNDPM